MAGNGPARVPTEILAMRGSRLVAGRLDAPKGVDMDPEPPDDMNAEAQAIWAAEFPVLNAMRVMKQSDRRAFRRYCIMSARYDRLVRIDESPPAELSGADLVTLMVGVGNQLTALAGRLESLEKQFGMTPSTRSLVKVAPDANGKEGKMKFLNLKGSKQA